MVSNPDPVHVVIGHSKHPLPDRALFSFPCVLMLLEGNPFQAILDGKVDALVIPAADLPDRLPASLDVAALLTDTILPDVDATHPLHDKIAIVVQKDRADLKVLFAPLDIRQTYGKVYLTGAGAGGRDYLTIRADALLRNADVIFYDDLIDTGLLDFYTAEKIFVGKRKGRHHADQDVYIKVGGNYGEVVPSELIKKGKKKI